jgi:hypothetical protein
LKGESKELVVSRLAVEVESARRGMEDSELRGTERSIVRAVWAREAIVLKGCCGQLGSRTMMS